MLLLTLIGSIGLFLFAMQQISESLQKIAGDHLRHLPAAMTGNAMKGMLSGLGITAYVQSSMITTMMAVSFVNAAIISLPQAIAVIMGANIGTTVTAWIIASIGFSFDVAIWAFPLIAIALPFFSARKSTANACGELLLGIALFIISLATMQEVFDHEQLSHVPEWITLMSNWGFGNILLLLFIGIVLTALVRSSTVTFALVLLACTGGWLSFDMGCALILGANIGTCITTLIASRRGNAMARRAALSHLVFNVLGLVWALSTFVYLCPLIAQLCPMIGLGDVTDEEVAPLALAFFHTLFNLLTTCLLLPFSGQLAKLVTRIIPNKSKDTESFQLQYINGGNLPSSGEMALVQVQKEASRYAEDTYKMYQLVWQMLNEPMGSERQLGMMEQVRQMEEDSDKAELEIADFLNKVPAHTLSMSGEQLCRNLYKVVEELESIADSLYHCSATLYQKSEQRIRFTPQMNTELAHMFELTDAALKHMVHVLSLEEVPSNALDKAYNFEDEINNLRSQLRTQMLDAIEKRTIEYQQYSYFIFMINECEKIGDYVINVVAAASL